MTQQASQVRARDVSKEGSVPSTGEAPGPMRPSRTLRWFLVLGFAASLGTAQALFAPPPWLLFPLGFALGYPLLWFCSRADPRASTTLRAARASSSPEARSEQSFGQYRLVRKLGEGGMGVVYEARHALLRRPTALKLLRKLESEGPEAEREAVQRFEREVQLTSQLSHPNTIVIYDYGRSDDGVFYYAMEYIDGIDLDRLIRVDGPLAPAHVIHLALQICGSLAEAHARSLIHRDIKPSNLLVYERAFVPDTVKVLDFGLVKSLVSGPVVSAAHVLVGTPLYTAPEVLRDPSRASPRSDIYALGAVLHWLATGKTLQEAELLGPSALANLPVDLERVIMRCTEPDPTDRPESMKAVAAELAACRDSGRWTEEASRRYWDERGKRLSQLLAEPAPAGAETLAAS